jgi:hypothetical protein
MDAGGIFDLRVHLNNRDIFINIKSAGSQRLLYCKKELAVVSAKKLYIRIE